MYAKARSVNTWNMYRHIILLTQQNYAYSMYITYTCQHTASYTIQLYLYNTIVFIQYNCIYTIQLYFDIALFQTFISQETTEHDGTEQMWVKGLPKVRTQPPLVGFKPILSKPQAESLTNPLLCPTHVQRFNSFYFNTQNLCIPDNEPNTSAISFLVETFGRFNTSGK